MVIRYINVFGSRQDPNNEYSAVIPLFVTAISCAARPTSYGDGLHSRDSTYVDNVVRGNLVVATAAEVVGKVLNVACGSQFALLQLVASINRVLGTSIEPLFADPRPGDVRESLADTAAARAVLGIRANRKPQ